MGLTVGGTQHHPRHGEVTVLELRPGCDLDVKVCRTADADTFWTRSTEFPRELYQSGSEAIFVRSLADYSLRVSVRNFDECLRAAVEYREWCGEELADESVYLRPHPTYRDHKGRERVFNREWRLRFKIQRGMVVPFPLSSAGTTGHSFNHLDTSKEQGILFASGRVEVNWSSIISRLVRLGLRATLPYGELR